jgi:hypothetical protein
MSSGGPILTGNFASDLIKGYIRDFYDNSKPLVGQWEVCGFEKLNSSKNYEIDLLVDNFTLATLKPQGSPVTYQSAEQRYPTVYTHLTWATGFQISREMKEDGQELDVVSHYTPKLHEAYVRTQDVNAASIFNFAFSSSVTYGDGVALCTASHPVASGTQSNILTNAAYLSETAVEDLLIQITTAKDFNGNYEALRGIKLLIPPQLMFEATRIFDSVLQNDTSNNAINAMRVMGLIPEVVHNNYFTFSATWFIITNEPTALKYYERTAPTIEQDEMFDTNVDKYKISGRYSFGVSNWRGVFSGGNNG